MANIIATLVPAGDSERAELAFQMPHNKKWRQTSQQKHENEPARSSRDPTPALSLPRNDSRIQLSFDQELRDPSRGFSFGTDPKRCDILLGHLERPKGISGVHFYKSFDDREHLVLQDCARHGTAVSYSGLAKSQIRRHFSWILDLDLKKATVIEVHVPHENGLSFRVENANSSEGNSRFAENVREFLERGRNSDPPVGPLHIGSLDTTAAPSEALTPRQERILLDVARLGVGSFGEVFKAVDAQTGFHYAIKHFRPPPVGQDVNRPQLKINEWLSRIQRESRIMKEHPCEYTVPLVEFREEPRPFLVGRNRIGDCPSSVLKALDFLHPRGVAHRDLKPDNILVESRSPFMIRIADFGLASDTDHFETFCGSKFYAAPEIYSGHAYTASVDCGPWE